MADQEGLARRIGRRVKASLQPSDGQRSPATPPPAPEERPVREVAVEPTHLGPVLDAGVARVRGRMQEPGRDADYDLAREHFDVEHFLLQAPQFLAIDRDPLRNFLDNGSNAKARPEINFDTRAYLARHPERAGGGSPYVAWLRGGRDAGEVADPAPGLELLAPVVGREVPELAGELADLRTDLQHRLRHGRLGEVFAKVAEIEPLVADAWPATGAPIIPPFYSEVTTAQVAAVHAAQEQAGFERARVVIVVSDPRWGSGRRAEGHLAHALAREVDPSEVVVVYTDRGGRAPAGRFPEGVREVDLASHLEGVPADAAGRALVELVRSLRADAVVNINSVLLYRAMIPHGKALAASERLFVVMFCNEQLALGNWVGLPLRYVYRNLDLVEGVITDSHHLAGWIAERHQLPPEMERRVHVLSAPVDPSVEVPPRSVRELGARPQVYWAGRFDRQKRVGLVFEIARRLPQVDLHMWGEEVLNRPDLAVPPDNVHLRGTYADLGELDLGAADAWLYTSGWDGVPSQLLEVAMTGVPLVGSLVGGTGEVLHRDLSWPVEAIDDPAAYVDALREVLADPEGARDRALALRERLVHERTADQYAEAACALLLRPEGARP